MLTYMPRNATSSKRLNQRTTLVGLAAVARIGGGGY